MSIGCGLALIKLENEEYYNSLGEKKEISHLYKCPKYTLVEGDEVLVEANGVNVERGSVVRVLDYIMPETYAFIMELNQNRELQKVVAKYNIKKCEYEDEQTEETTNE